MLSVVVDAQRAPERLAGMLAQLTPLAVAGLVREVVVATPRGHGGAEALCEATGALIEGDLTTALQRTRADWLLLLPAELRLRDGWVERLQDALARGPRPARLVGMKPGAFRPAPRGVLVRRAEALAQPDLHRLGRRLGLAALRIG
ncbi:MAG TPA: cell wall biosynthesis glycosyltransferase [Phenylobacterium sp.]|uniref:cell wall biosynthesis glycosyltransferase n=1 Tax=Phenylobacterium sp. TaxID=1871053 RepID=UPI002CA7AF15|nr:cell wall biosynthesis glycosyltransferase [Phenylobacterium sp.]HSV02449.1 cell wall biosynthesis glycosyltransferase [Phenylobacterium sp.]